MIKHMKKHLKRVMLKNRIDIFKKKAKRYVLVALVALGVVLALVIGIKIWKTVMHKWAIDALNIPEYSGMPYAVINGNIPFFEEKDYKTKSFEKYSLLDGLGRCGVAYACVGRDLMPTEERQPIGNIKPTGWNQAKYEGIVDSSPPYLYNRCHLIAYCLTGENANERNLITGTRYMNVLGMLPFEEKVAKYLDENDNHVIYRATPIFEGNNLLASGVLLEAYSVEDKGKGICFCVYCYNVQPGIEIDYSVGSSKAIK